MSRTLTDNEIEALVNEPDEDEIEFVLDQSDIEPDSDNEVQIQHQQDDIEEQANDEIEIEAPTVDRLEVAVRVRRQLTIEDIQDDDFYNPVPVPETEQEREAVLEKRQRNIDEISIKYSNQQQHNVRGRQSASNLPTDSGAKLRVPRGRCDTELKSFHQVYK